ncbi:glycosyltransferase [Sphingomonas sp. S2-65]|uniref:glycosyltransferase n=1 Tax=Sphingomonas sp. S2-65 TaxID=2903960 RepID=UPI001F3A30CB|nr:glycosyltransferase [Sphingomonas sp. S2-65]UYY57047.1 glycosyltransferase [Sphingomonas sp. S2-65]
MDRPFISFAMANHNGERFIRDAIGSALAQRGVDVELLVVDDCSSDRSPLILEAAARADPRVRAFRLDQNRGPAGARNVALAAARGDWFAVLDSDDLLHPDRSLRLIAEAVNAGADMIADDLLVFDHEQADAVHMHLRRDRRQGSQWIELPDYLAETRMYGRQPNLGFLKPMFRLDFLRRAKLVYNEDLRIAEDDDLVLRALVAGGRYRLLPQPMYFYRKHGTSISHRLSPANAGRMLAAAAMHEMLLVDAGAPVLRAWRARMRSLRQAHGFTMLIDALKHRDAAKALRTVVANPRTLLLLRQPIAARVRRLLMYLRPKTARRPTGPDAVLFVSRQRLIGATNGSSAYLLGLAGAVRAAGLVPHLLQPSPLLFGRTPFFRLRSEMAVFETIMVRRGWRVGSWLIAARAGIFGAATLAVAKRALRRAGFKGAWTAERLAPYAIAAPWLAEDVQYVARHGRGRGHVAIADYVFQTEAIPYLLDPGRPAAVVMHDLFSARAGQFSPEAVDSVAALAEDEEIALLSRADVVIAIQAEEAAFVSLRVPASQAILAPMAVPAVPDPQPGDAETLLFVGSNTAPNVHGLTWFLEKVWPRIAEAAPGTRLFVAGTVGSAVTAPHGVELLGLVDDLAALYSRAGIVISPLRQGSGLKIKLVEAIAHGKACVVTSVTLQGVETILSDAVLHMDEPEQFADAILVLQRDDIQRGALATRALTAARTHFGPEAAFAEFRLWLASAQETCSGRSRETPHADIVDLYAGGEARAGVGVSGPSASYGKVGN